MSAGHFVKRKNTFIHMNELSSAYVSIFLCLNTAYQGPVCWLSVLHKIDPNTDLNINYLWYELKSKAVVKWPLINRF